MTKEQEKMYEKIKATGRYTEEQLARVRAGLEKEPRKIDIKKSQLHYDKAMDCLRLEKIDPTIEVNWSPEDDDGDAYIFILVPNEYIFTGLAKKILEDAASAADTVSYTYVDTSDVRDTVAITLAFTGIIQDPNKPDNFSAS